MSNCCGAEPSYLSDEICGDCLEHAEFNDEDSEAEHEWRYECEERKIGGHL